MMIFNACTRGDLDYIKHFYEQKGRNTFLTRDENRKSFLYIAAQNGHSEVVEILLKDAVDHNNSPTQKELSTLLNSDSNHEEVVGFDYGAEWPALLQTALS